MKVLSLPRDDRPREKLYGYGASVLSDAELLALLLGSGTKGKNVIDVSREVLESFGGLRGLCESRIARAKCIPGIGRSKLALLMAVGEIAKRINTEAEEGALSLFEAAEAYRKRRYLEEECHVLFLDGRSHVTGSALIGKGRLDRIDVCVNDILRLALVEGATRFALLHVHTSGYPLPSGEDIKLTTSILKRAGELKLLFYDHLIVSGEGVYSFREQGQMSG